MENIQEFLQAAAETSDPLRTPPNMKTEIPEANVTQQLHGPEPENIQECLEEDIKEFLKKIN